MELFSKRKGLKPVKSMIQKDSMDDDLRNGLWNALGLHYWQNVRKDMFGGEDFIQHDRITADYIKALWLDYYKIPLDTLENNWRSVYNKIRSDFFKFKWYEVFDFLEFTVKNHAGRDSRTNDQFMTFCNQVLEKELSAYRFIKGKITEITSKEEVEAIEKAIISTDTLKPVNQHLTKALDLFADRKSPDYRNSIKESISAVESLCKLITGDAKATLGKALKKFEDKVEIHGALKKGFGNLYGYTSDAQGIRHALIDESNLESEDAKFMLVSCSAFINYLIAKAARAGIQLTT